MRYFLLGVFVCGLVGCAVTPQLTEQQKNMIPTLTACIQNAPNGKKAPCALDFYSSIGSTSDAFYDKPAMLSFATNLYQLLVRLDRNQISGDDAKIQLMQITNNFERERQEAGYRSAQANREAALQRQQIFLNMAKALQPPPGAFGVTCYSVNSGMGNYRTVCY
jgi:hypothetical protein